MHSRAPEIGHRLTAESMNAVWRDVLRNAQPLSACGTAALEYAARGWEVFPAPPGEKKSHKSAKHSGGVKWGKTINPKIIGEDFCKWPNANVAIVTGATSGIFVIEADTPKGHGVDGVASIKALQAEHGSLPKTLMAISPSGSVHRYYKHPGAGIKIKNSVGKMALGVDIRGDGGMVIAPPSIKPGVGQYRWLNDLPIADAPAWLIEAATKKEAKKSSPRPPAAKQAQAKNNAERRHQLKADADHDEIEAALMAIPNNAGVDWDTWNRIGMAVYSATSGSAAGFAMFNKWSQKYPGYNADDTSAKWEWLGKCPPTEIGVGTIFYLADQASPSWRREFVVSLICPDPVQCDRFDNLDLLERAIVIFDDAQPLPGSLGEKYLAGLGLTVPDIAPEVLRFHPSCPIGKFNLPCLVAYVQDSQTNEPVGVHLTALSAEAIAMGLPGATGCETVGVIDGYSVIKLGGEPTASGELTIASTIEAGLRAMMFGFRPAWSVLSVDGIAAFPKPRFNTIKRLTVIVDREAVAAAEKCNARWGNLARIVVRSA
jgi:bifunctional DNA primase/polymerase-like protein/primase-like protein